MASEQEISRFRGLMIFGIIGPVIAISFTILDISLSPWYSWGSSALSDLGVHQYSFLFNGGLIIEAIANLIFAIGLRKLNLANSATASTLAVAGVSLGLVGIFNENYHPLHLIFALTYFIIFPIAIIAFSSGKRNSENYSRAVGYMCSAIGLVFIIVGIVQDFNVFSTPLGLGVYEFVEAVMLSLWTFYTGAFYLTRVEKANMDESVLDEKS